MFLFRLTRAASAPLTRRFLHHCTSSSRSNAAFTISPMEGCITRYIAPQTRLFHGIPNTSPREMAELEDRVWSSVGTLVKDPEIDLSLKDLGWMNRRLAVSEDGTIQVLLKLPTMLHPSLDRLKESVRNVAEREVQTFMSEKSLDTDGIKVNVEAMATSPVPFTCLRGEDLKEIEARLGPGLVNVSHYVAVYSCKGGVGKSTVAVNLAYELARIGGRVGLLDLDIYGPSLPVLVKPDDPAVRQSPLGKGMVYPIEHRGVKLLSLGFVSSKSGVPGSGQEGGAAVLRGPMAGKVVTQLLKGTDWGQLDVLILDLPPGTGDVQLTLCQDIELSGAVGVTTPSKLAIADARKGIQMFSELGVPTFAMVENMSYFECEGGGIHFPFGKGFKELMEDLGRGDLDHNNVCRLPISSSANIANEEGIPLSLSRPPSASTELEALRHLAHVVSRELFRLPYKPESSIGTVSFEESMESFELSSIHLSLDGDRLIVRAFSENGALQKRFLPKELRRRDPKSGLLLDPTNNGFDNESSTKMIGKVEIHRTGASKADIKDVINNLEKKGKVGYEVTWGDGSKFIYSRRAIAFAAGGRLLHK